MKFEKRRLTVPAGLKTVPKSLKVLH